jgi:signal transduction histidine kinase
VAHEVRNPLNAIQAVTAAMAQELESNLDVKCYFDHIQSQVKRLSVLMRDLLELGRPIQPSSLKRESVPEICNDAVLLWRQSSDADVDLDCQTSGEGAACLIKANADRMQQVVINLIENAAQHSPPGGKIALSLERTANATVRIRVRDAGSGVDEAQLGRVFEPFFTMTKEGVGLGLSIVKNIVEQHQGRIILKNNDPPPGCTVEIELPLLEDHS